MQTTTLGKSKPPQKRTSAVLTLHQRRVLDAWRAGGQVRLAQLARMFSTTPSAICRTLRVARAKIYGLASVPKGRRFRLVSLSLCFTV